MHSLGRTLANPAALSRSCKFKDLVAARTLATSSKSMAAETQAQERQEAKAKKMKKAVKSKSFVQNIFRGIVEPEQAFPYPNTLDEDQRETLEMLVPITEKFFMEQNDPDKNDASSDVPEHTVQVSTESDVFFIKGSWRPNNLHWLSKALIYYYACFIYIIAGTA